MAKVDKAEAMRLLKKGYTQREVAERCGCTRQYISQIFPGKGRRYRAAEYDTMVFPGIANWLRKNRVTVNGLADKTGLYISQLSQTLHGRSNPTKRTIDAILIATGMTYEEAFGVGKNG